MDSLRGSREVSWQSYCVERCPLDTTDTIFRAAMTTARDSQEQALWCIPMEGASQEDH